MGVKREGGKKGRKESGEAAEIGGEKKGRGRGKDQ